MKLQLSLSAKKLPNVAGAFKGKSDPFAIVSLLDDESDVKPKILGKTEVIKNSLNPDWVTTFNLDYELGRPVKVIISLYDHVRKGENISMGSAVFDVGYVLGSKGNTKAKSMKHGGVIYAKITNVKDHGKLRFCFRGTKLKNVEGGLFGKSDPFFEIDRRDIGTNGSEWNTVYRSKVVKNNLDPAWEEDTIDLDTLCGGDLDLPFGISVFDHESSGKHVSMGQVQINVNGLLKAKNSAGLKLQTRKGVVGTLVVTKAEIFGLNDANVEAATNKMANTSLSSSVPSPVPVPPAAQPYVSNSMSAPVPMQSRNPSFIDYIEGGCEINLCVGIDFTGSNGDPRDPGTLHYRHPDGTKNDYEKAICAIGGILQKYDSNKTFPVWGFGAKYGGVVRHCFQCGNSAEVEGVDGIIQAYRQTFQSGLIMSGPTDITEIIQTAAAFANSRQEEAKNNGRQAYSVLLILTDGSVTDVQATAQTLGLVSNAPLSIVIVGVGNADFSAMQFLDNCASTGAHKDVTKFVHFNAHAHDPNSLTATTLEEIPSQLTSYFSSHGIQPLPPVTVGEDEIVIEPQEEEIDLSMSFGNDEEVVVNNMSGYVPARPY
eukprot:CAMPEP_0184867048 /NCGR_PEP_ID=MMETSP0580-20130426/24871_1 /TAXON_ID=1118495 /ORGANISM="Dactyliosolen fragilissimus" /LENGTH=597 /DNA_ID=CAMNT_0027367059 /DNA_START=14 /DNA_END=1807 /DNA_ORIENTATION=+